MMDDRKCLPRREALRCMAYGTAGTLFTLSGGILAPIDLALAAERRPALDAGQPLFVQFSDTHIGFSKDANPDVAGTLRRAIDLVNALPQQPALTLHTGDITHLSEPGQFDLAQQLFSSLRTTEMHTTPGEHDVADATVSEYFARFGKASQNRGYYSFDHAGVHFISLINVLNFKAGGLGTLGQQQLDWVTADLRSRSSSTPIVVFAHMPLWTLYAPWGWGTADAEPLLQQLRRFGSVMVLNGHIHQIMQKVEGNVTFHTARSTAYPQPAAGVGSGPGPLKVPPEQLPAMLGVTRLAAPGRPPRLALSDTTLAGPVEAQVQIRNFMFEPTPVQVRAGDTVRWVNRDDEPHTVVSDTGLFRSAALDTDMTFAFRFDQPGTYRVLCSIHPQMGSTVVVS